MRPAEHGVRWRASWPQIASGLPHHEPVVEHAVDRFHDHNNEGQKIHTVRQILARKGAPGGGMHAREAVHHRDHGCEHHAEGGEQTYGGADARRDALRERRQAIEATPDAVLAPVLNKDQI